MSRRAGVLIVPVVHRSSVGFVGGRTRGLGAHGPSPSPIVETKVEGIVERIEIHLVGVG